MNNVKSPLFGAFSLKMVELTLRMSGNAHKHRNEIEALLHAPH